MNWKMPSRSGGYRSMSGDEGEVEYGSYVVGGTAFGQFSDADIGY